MPVEYNLDGSRKRFKYTNLEERKMLHFLANEMRAGNKEAGKKGLLIWKKYVNTTVIEKTPSGLESHFRKIMLPNLYLKCNEVVKDDFFLILRVFRVVLNKKKIDHIENSLDCSIVVDKANVFQYAVFFSEGDRQTLPGGDGVETDIGEMSTTCCHDENRDDSVGSGAEGIVSSISLASLQSSPFRGAEGPLRQNDVEAHRQHLPEVVADVGNETLTGNNRGVSDLQNIATVNQVNQSRRVTSSPVDVDRPNPLVTFFEMASSISGENENNNEMENYHQFSMDDFQSTQSTVVEEVGNQTMETDTNNNRDENNGSQLAENRGPVPVQSLIPEKKAKLIKKSSDDFPITSPTHKRIFLDRVVAAIRVYGGGDVDSSNVEAVKRANAIFDGVVDDDEQPLPKDTKQRIINGLYFLFQQPTTSGLGAASRSNSSSISSRNRAGMGGDADYPDTSRRASDADGSSLPLRRSRRLRQRESSFSPTSSTTATAKMKHRLDVIKKSPR